MSKHRTRLLRALRRRKEQARVEGNNGAAADVLTIMADLVRAGVCLVLRRNFVHTVKSSGAESCRGQLDLAAWAATHCFHDSAPRLAIIRLHGLSIMSPVQGAVAFDPLGPISNK